jgi:hypothetical protein
MTNKPSLRCDGKADKWACAYMARMQSDCIPPTCFHGRTRESKARSFEPSSKTSVMSSGNVHSIVRRLGGLLCLSLLSCWHHRLSSRLDLVVDVAVHFILLVLVEGSTLRVSICVTQYSRLSTGTCPISNFVRFPSNGHIYSCFCDEMPPADCQFTSVRRHYHHCSFEIPRHIRLCSGRCKESTACCRLEIVVIGIIGGICLLLFSRY